MVLNVHSDTSYLSAPRARSHASGYFFLGSLPVNSNPIKLNGAIHITCIILKLVAAFAAKAKLGALFLNAQEAKVLHLTLAKLGHPQPPTPIHIDNTTTISIIKNTIKCQCSRAMEMRYFWLLDGKTQQYFSFYYQPRQENLGNYPSKHHMADIHQHVRPYYVHTDKSPTLLPWALKPSIWQGCAEILGDPTPRSPHHHVLETQLVCLSPQVFLTTEYLASHESSTGYPLPTTILEEHQQSSTHNSREHFLAVTFLLSSLDSDGNKCGRRATATATTWAMAMATRLAGDKEGKCKGSKSNGDGNEGGWQWQQWLKPFQRWQQQQQWLWRWQTTTETAGAGNNH
jgi:hypothetical protein